MGEFLLRWGICCSGMVSNEFTLALNMLPKTQHQIVAIATRNEKRSKEFASLHSVPKAYGSYKELAADPEIDIVYIGAIQPHHFSLSKMMLEADKHVVCEKPLGINAKEAREITRIAKSRNKFLLEGLTTRFFPAYAKVKEIINSGTIGVVTHVQAQYGMNLGDHIKSKELGGGTLLSLGGYPIDLAQLVFGEKPIQQEAFGILHKDTGVDTDCYMFLRYSGDRTALLSASVAKNLQNEEIIYGTKGSMRIYDLMYAPTKLDVRVTNAESKTHDFPLPGPKPDYKPFYVPHGEGFAYEAEEARKCIMQGKTESPLLTWDMSIELAEICDAARQQIGYDLPQDKVEY